MERLTHRKKDGTVVYLKDNDMIAPVNMSGFDVRQVMQKLAEYEESDLVPKRAYEQMAWERDMAINQLSDHGIPFGGKADVQAVRHGKWLKFDDNGTEYQTCSECNYDMQVGCGADSWCPACGALMDGDNENGQIKQSE